MRRTATPMGEIGTRPAVTCRFRGRGGKDSCVGDTGRGRRTGRGATLLEEARSILASTEAGAWKAAIRELVEENTFVPADRRDIYEPALVAGFDGDNVLFLHLVSPQLENSLRSVFRAAGLTVTSMDSQGVQEERDLNQFLRMEAAKDVMGEDLLWEARALLIEKTGPNLRNRLCHGLLGTGDFERPAVNTLLWLTVLLLLAAKAASGGPVR